MISRWRVHGLQASLECRAWVATLMLEPIVLEYALTVRFSPESVSGFSDDDLRMQWVSIYFLLSLEEDLGLTHESRMSHVM